MSDLTPTEALRRAGGGYSYQTEYVVKRLRAHGFIIVPTAPSEATITAMALAIHSAGEIAKYHPADPRSQERRARAAYAALLALANPQDPYP